MKYDLKLFWSYVWTPGANFFPCNIQKFNEKIKIKQDARGVKTTAMTAHRKVYLVCKHILPCAKVCLCSIAIY